MHRRRPSAEVGLQLSTLEKHLLNDYQHGFPLSARPYAEMAEQQGVSEQEIIDTLDKLQNMGAVSRIGPVLQPNRVGASTLAAIAVPTGRLQEVADQVSAYPEVNHNYERLHEFNLWFVVTASSQEHLQSVLDDISQDTGLPLLDLPMVQDYFIDLGFDLKWN